MKTTIALLAALLCTATAHSTISEPAALEAVSDMPSNGRASASAAETTSDDGSVRAVSSGRVAGSFVMWEIVCKTKDSLRWSHPAWTAKRCQDVAAALSVMPEPVTMLAVAANESGLHAAAIRKAREGVFDVGLTGIRCVVVDGKCTNGAAKGYTIAELMDPLTNLRVAHVLATSMGAKWLDRWNGDPEYAARIHVLATAIRGEWVEVRGKGAKWDRIRGMQKRILWARDRQRKS